VHDAIRPSGSGFSFASAAGSAGGAAWVLFAPSALGMIILPLMLFHQIQLMVCAVLAQKWSQRADEVQARPEQVRQ
jgi:predicted Na+-dependent transporter